MARNINIESPEDIAYIFRELKNESREKAFVINLDENNKIINIDQVSLGSTNESIINPMEAFKSSVLSNAKKNYLIHNHPTGDVVPSEEDIDMNIRLKKVGEYLGIDHVGSIIMNRTKFGFLSERLPNKYEIKKYSEKIAGEVKVNVVEPQQVVKEPLLSKQIVDSPDKAAGLSRAILDKNTDAIVAIYLNGRLGINAIELKGFSLDNVEAKDFAREIIKGALLNNATNVIITSNYPLAMKLNFLDEVHKTLNLVAMGMTDVIQILPKGRISLIDRMNNFSRREQFYLKEKRKKYNAKQEIDFEHSPEVRKVLNQIEKIVKEEAGTLEQMAGKEEGSPLEEIFNGKRPMVTPRDYGDKEEWLSILGKVNYMRVFSGKSTAEHDDEVAESLGLSLSEFEMAMKDYLLTRKEGKRGWLQTAADNLKKGVSQTGNASKFQRLMGKLNKLNPQKEISTQDLEEMFGEKEELTLTSEESSKIDQAITKEPVEKYFDESIPDITAERILSDVSRKMLRKLYDDIVALGGIKDLENIPSTIINPEGKNIAQMMVDLNEIGGYGFRDSDQLSNLLRLPVNEKIKTIRRAILQKEFKMPRSISALKNAFKRAILRNDAEALKKLTQDWVNILPAGRRPIKLYEETPDWAEMFRPMFAEYPKGIKEWIKTLIKRYGISGIDVLNKFGEAGKELVVKFQEVESQSMVKAGGMKADMKYEGKIDKLNDMEGYSVVVQVEGLQRIPIRNEKVDKIAEIWNRHRQEIANFAKGMNVVVRNKDGDVFLFVPKTNYFPHYIRFDKLLNDKNYQNEVIEFNVLTGKFKDPASAQSFLEHFNAYRSTQGKDLRFINDLAKINNISAAEAEYRLREYLFPTNPRRFGHLEKERELDIPLYDPNPARVFEDFYDKVWQRLYEIKEFGQNDDTARRLITKIGQDGHDWNLAQRIFEVSTNKIPFDPVERSAWGGLMDLQAVKLVLSQIIQITQQADIIGLTGWRNWVKSLGKSLSQAGAEEAMRMGANMNKSLYQAVSGIERHGFGEKFLKATGFTFMDNLNRIVASNNAIGLLNKLVKNPKGKNLELLKDLLVTDQRVKEFLERGKASYEDNRIAGFRLAKITQFTVRLEDLPVKWRDNLTVKSMVMYKSFSQQKARYVWRYMIKHPTRLPRWLLATLIFTEVAVSIRSAIRGKKRAPLFSAQRLVEDLTYLGTFGMLSDIIEASNYSGGLARWAFGPLWGDAFDIGEGLLGQPKKILRKFVDYIPCFVAPLVNPAITALILEPIKKRILFPYQQQGSETSKLKMPSLPKMKRPVTPF